MVGLLVIVSSPAVADDDSPAPDQQLVGPAGLFCVNPGGDASCQEVAASGTGDADAFAAASAGGVADGFVAASATGHAHGDLEVAPCEVLLQEGLAAGPCTNAPPSTPSEPSPANGSHVGLYDTSLVLEWSHVEDPEGDAFSYSVRFGSASTGLQGVDCDDDGTPRCEVTIEQGRIYHWQVAAEDEFGAESRSPVWSFSTDNRLATSTGSILGEVGLVPGLAGGFDRAQVSWQGSYDEAPLVFSNVQTQNGPENPDDILVEDVSTSGMTTALCEWDKPDRCHSHVEETAGTVAVDESALDAHPGMEAGTVTTDKALGVTVEFTSSFDSTPLVFAHTQTTNGDEPSWVAEVSDVDRTAFTLSFCEQETPDGCDDDHPPETLAWWAIDPSQAAKGDRFDWGSTLVVDSEWTEISFGQDFENTPVVLVSTQTDTGGQFAMYDEARKTTTDGAEIRYCESDGLNTCDTHLPETVAWLAVEPGDI